MESHTDYRQNQRKMHGHSNRQDRQLDQSGYYNSLVNGNLRGISTPMGRWETMALSHLPWYLILKCLDSRQDLTEDQIIK